MTLAIPIEDIRSLAYFHQSKGDMTSFCRWEELQPALEREFPELLHYRRKLLRAQRMLDLTVESMLGEAEARELKED